MQGNRAGSPGIIAPRAGKKRSEMPSIVKVAQRAGVSVETAVRTLNDQPGSEREARHVAEAVAELGRPPRAVVESLGVLTAARAVGEPRSSESSRLAFDDSFEEGLGPTPRYLGYMAGIIDSLTGSLAALERDVPEDQRERVAEAKLLLTLLLTGWERVEQRVQAVARKLDEMAAPPGGPPPA